MRTAISVHEPATVTIRATDPRDGKVQIFRYNPADGPAAAQAAIGSHKLETGIYLVVSSSELEVQGHGTTTQIVANDKDSWPDPKVTVIALEPGATAASLQEFFTVAKDISLDD